MRAAVSKASAAKSFLFSLGCAHSEQAGQTQSTSLREENQATSPIPFGFLAWILAPPHILSAGILRERLVLLSLRFNSFPQAVSVTFIILTIKQMLPDVFEVQTHSSNGLPKAETKVTGASFSINSHIPPNTQYPPNIFRISIFLHSQIFLLEILRSEKCILRERSMVSHPILKGIKTL